MSVYLSTVSWVITILGFLATIIGSYLTIIMFRSPMKRLNKYLKKDKKWERVELGRKFDHWKYKDHPEFTIEEDKESRDWGASKEDWMKDYTHPCKRSHFVIAKANGQLLVAEEFIVMDEGRISVPLPKMKKNIESGKMKYYYTHLQVDLARIASIHNDYETIEKFMFDHSLKVREDD